MAKPFQLIERDGRKIRIYESGLEMDDQTGAIVKPAPGTVIRTGERSTELHRRRREKTARLTRRRITDRMNSGLLPPGTLPVADSAEATAEAAAVLWEDVVMNPDAYPRDRVLTFDRLTQFMGTSPATDDQPAATDAARLNAAAALVNGETARVLLQLWNDVAAAQARQAQPGAVVLDAASRADPVPLPPPGAVRDVE